MELTLARREKMKAAIAYIGGSGSGKTLSMLITAYGMMKEAYPDLDDGEIFQKIGVVDTEHKRAQIYADMTIAGLKIYPFYHIDLQPPFSPNRYDDAIRTLKQAGCEVVVVDSLSHAWEGEGGILDLQQQAGGNFQAWAKIKPQIQAFIKSLTENDVHILASMRTKQDYQVEQGETGKLNIKKLGLKPIQKDDLEYEFMIVWQLDQDHVARTTKDNSGMFEGSPGIITPEYGSKLFKWLDQGVDVKAEEEAKRQEYIGSVNSWRKEYESIERLVQELEAKVNGKLEDMPLKLTERVHQLAKQKLEQTA